MHLHNDFFCYSKITIIYHNIDPTEVCITSTNFSLQNFTTFVNLLFFSLTFELDITRFLPFCNYLHSLISFVKPVVSAKKINARINKGINFYSVQPGKSEETWSHQKSSSRTVASVRAWRTICSTNSPAMFPWDKIYNVKIKSNVGSLCD